MHSSTQTKKVIASYNLEIEYLADNFTTSKRWEQMHAADIRQGILDNLPFLTRVTVKKTSSNQEE